MARHPRNPAKENEAYRTLSGAIRFSCALLFAAFSFTLLFCLKGELLAWAQHVWSGGVTHYDLLTGAVVITVALLGVQWALWRLVPLPLQAHALSYMPSALLLAMLTNITPEVVAHFHLGAWAWVAPLVLALFALLAWGARLFCPPLRHIRDGFAILSANLLILLVLCALCAGIDRTPDTLLYELKMERLIGERRYGEATHVAEKFLHPTPRMLALRGYALARTGALAERLLDMPQPFGADGLLCVADTARRLRRIDTQAICAYLGAPCGRIASCPHHPDPTDRYLELLAGRLQAQADALARADTVPGQPLRAQRRINRARQQRTLDYTLCRLLLQRRMSDFAGLLPSYAPLHPGEPLPSLYAEALCLLDSATRAGVGEAFAPDSITLQRFAEYRALRDAIPEPVPRRNLTRRQWGDTFWWYYENPQ